MQHAEHVAYPRGNRCVKRGVFMSRNIVGLLVGFVMCVPLIAQNDHASLNGTVVDFTGAIVPGVTVEAVSLNTGLHRQTITGETGTYQLPALPIGSYKVTFNKSGFRTVTVGPVFLTLG